VCPWQADRNVGFPYGIVSRGDPLLTMLTITIHVSDHNLSHPHQLAYKRGHSTKLLLAKMTALDRNLAVGIVYVDFRKAFQSICHNTLLQKLQGAGIAGDLWSWMKDYLTDLTKLQS